MYVFNMRLVFPSLHKTNLIKEADWILNKNKLFKIQCIIFFYQILYMLHFFMRII